MKHNKIFFYQRAVVSRRKMCANKRKNMSRFHCSRFNFPRKSSYFRTDLFLVFLSPFSRNAFAYANLFFLTHRYCWHAIFILNFTFHPSLLLSSFFPSLVKIKTTKIGVASYGIKAIYLLRMHFTIRGRVQRKMFRGDYMSLKITLRPRNAAFRQRARGRNGFNKQS